MGCMEALDVAAKRVMGALKGAGGSVRALRLAGGGTEAQGGESDRGLSSTREERGDRIPEGPTLPLIAASAGLDRFLRIHDAVSRK